MGESARDLLELEVLTQYEVDGRGRLTGTRYAWPQVALAVATDGYGVRLGSDVDDRIAADIASVVSRLAPVEDPSRRPAGVDACRSMLAGSRGYSADQIGVRSGPGFLIPPDLPLWPVARGELICSDNATAGQLDLLRSRRPDQWWEAGEWADLVAGRFGPFAMVVDGEVVSAFCHAARLTPDGTEAGVRTHPDFWGRGLAPAVTTAWAASRELGDRTRFYSTSADNLASQRVAAKLGLRPLGWIWQLRWPTT